jgi:hypothetical protein
MTSIANLLAPDWGLIASKTADQLASTRAVADLPPVTRDAVLKQVATPFTELGQLTIGDILLFGWQQVKAFHTAAHESVRLNQPQTVTLRGLQVPVDYHPAIEVTVSGQRIARLDCALAVELELLAFIGTVAAGRLMAVRCDAFTATASFSITGHQVASRTAPLDLLVELPLPKAGIPLMHMPAQITEP